MSEPYPTSKRERVLREHMANLPPLTDHERKLQRMSSVYGNLACTTNHKPSRSAFRTIALREGWTEEEFDAWADERTGWVP